MAMRCRSVGLLSFWGLVDWVELLAFLCTCWRGGLGRGCCRWREGGEGGRNGLCRGGRCGLLELRLWFEEGSRRGLGAGMVVGLLCKRVLGRGLVE